MTGTPSPEARERQRRKEIIKYAEKRLDTVIEQIKTGQITSTEAKRKIFGIVIRYGSYIPEEHRGPWEALVGVALQYAQLREIDERQSRPTKPGNR